MDSEVVSKMRSKATRYRELADAASDHEAAKSLREAAGELEVIIPVLEDRVPEVEDLRDG